MDVSERLRRLTTYRDHWLGDIDVVFLVRVRVDDNNFSGINLGDWQLNARNFLLDNFFFDLPGFL